jgi:hypothetical protein
MTKMEYLLTAVGIILGWFGNHFYSIRGGKEARAAHAELRGLIEKLPESFVAAVAADRRESLTVKEVNALLRKLTIDETTGKYTSCPKCGSSHLKEFHDDEVDADYDGAYLVCSYDGVECLDCDWRYIVTTSPSGEVTEKKIIQDVP